MKTVFISGATAGFGLALAHKYAREGYRVIATGRRLDRLQALQKEYSEGIIHIHAFDIQDRMATRAVVDAITEPIDILINNAGLATGGLEHFENVSDEDIDTMVHTNIMGLVYLTKAILPKMKARDIGHIINIGSVSGTYPYSGASIYGGTKAFVRMFTLNLKAELIGTAIRVSNIEPGIADTEFSLVRFESEERAKKVCEHFEALTAEDIADIVYFVSTAPKHVNINALEVMSTYQSFAGFTVHRS